MNYAGFLGQQTFFSRSSLFGLRATTFGSILYDMSNAKLIKSLESLQRQSASAWEGAVDTAGPEYEGGSEARADEMQSLADSCDEAYDAAIEAVRAGDLDTAREHLGTAKSLESEGGDSSHAVTALEALDAAIEAIRTDVVIETMPDHHRSSHRAAGNWGQYPVNGATRYHCDPETAEELVAEDPDEYTHIVDGADPGSYPEFA